MGVKQDLIAALGEFTGTTLFLLLALGGAKTAQYTRSNNQADGDVAGVSNTSITMIAVSFGLSLLVTAWVFYRITGGLFNPAITLALFLIGGLNAFRAVLLTISQIAGGIAGAALVSGLTPFGGVETVRTTLGTGVNIAQGLFIEAFLTACLVLTVLFLAAEKHKSTYLAPIGIGLVLLTCHLFAVAWTGCGINPARSFGPAVVSGQFEGYHWIYWVGPLIGSLMAVSFYLMLKAFDYTSVVFGQDADHELAPKSKLLGGGLFKDTNKSLVVYHTLPSEGGGEEKLATVAPFNPNNKEMQDAIREGRASVLNADDAEKGLLQLAGAPDAAVVPTRSRHSESQGTTTAGAQSPAGGADVSQGEKTTAPIRTQEQPDLVRYSSPPANRETTFANGVPSMRPIAQNVGGIQVAASHNQGLASIGFVNDVLSRK